MYPLQNLAGLNGIVLLKPSYMRRHCELLTTAFGIQASYLIERIAKLCFLAMAQPLQVFRSRSLMSYLSCMPRLTRESRQDACQFLEGIAETNEMERCPGWRSVTELKGPSSVGFHCYITSTMSSPALICRTHKPGLTETRQSNIEHERSYICNGTTLTRNIGLPQVSFKFSLSMPHRTTVCSNIYRWYKSASLAAYVYLTVFINYDVST
ncbi:uncharacterized protein EV420DRAFT_1581518 [Desarmillaria tabescens]|uniref:Uncharacterized protein n=1 Tax=Armillaria tabescens TaxID=1929756 RepID=A0AA39JF45_ARMTA|nr:uncharacterized protein EV420DRAFT_1581518 [Desarmillaria tabescens]KAK0440651.1 hypothetical protein EV420DRAFT_1581518 [Desarmillaria tabescens]